MKAWKFAGHDSPAGPRPPGQTGAQPQPLTGGFIIPGQSNLLTSLPATLWNTAEIIQEAKLITFCKIYAPLWPCWRFRPFFFACLLRLKVWSNYCLLNVSRHMSEFFFEWIQHPFTALSFLRWTDTAGTALTHLAWFVIFISANASYTSHKCSNKSVYAQYNQSSLTVLQWERFSNPK